MNLIFVRATSGSMHLKTIFAELTGRVSRNVIFWLLITLYLERSRNMLWPAFPVVLAVMFISYGIPGYVHNLVLIPRFLIRRQYGPYVGLLIGLIIASAGFSWLITTWVNKLMPWLNYLGALGDESLPYHLFPTLLVLAMLTLGKFTADAIQNGRRLEQLEKQRLTSELSSLRSQINPHFLFNALNTIYGMARKQDRHTPDAVIKLSDILRYGLYECAEKEPTLEREIEFLQQYVEFARLRLHNHDRLRLSVDADDAEMLYIAPMLLTPFVENAIKHGPDDSGQEAWIDVSVAVKGNKLKFVCINSFKYQQNTPSPTPYASSGIGIKNVKRRLELLYKGKYDLNINDTDQKFLVELNIEL